MALVWIREDTPRWDESKRAIVGGALGLGELAPGEWFRVEDGGAIVGYGWMDCTWGDAEITVAVDPKRRREGIGAFIVSGLAKEAAARGVNYLYNAVRPTHPDPAGLTRWLEIRGFRPSGDGLFKLNIKIP
jgi:GNAT superfamily N-acetyltransferase